MSEILPAELWLRIMEFIPDDNIFKLAPVNDLFYNVALDRRYRALTLVTYDANLLNRRISRVAQDPLIAPRVRSLMINPIAIHWHATNSRFGREGNFSPVKSPYWPKTFINQETKLIIAEKLFDVFARLTNLNSYTITWRATSRPLSTFVTAFLSAVWSVLSATTTLHSLTLDMPFHDVCDVSSIIPFKSLTYLTTLSLKFGDTHVTPEYTLTDLASSLNDLSPSLRCLFLYVVGHFDFSVFFTTLKHFPWLRDLSLSLPCDPGHLSDTHGFTSFLDAHKTQLKSLDFVPHFCCGPRGTRKSAPHESEAWAFSVPSLPALHSLELRLNVFGVRDEYILYAPPKFTAAVARETLTIDKDPLTLSILGRLILLDDLRTLLSPFSPPKGKSEEDPASIRVPESLILETHILSPDLLHLLWSTLPRLKNLNLTYTWIGELGCEDERKFVKYLRRRTFPHWQLRNFTLKSTKREDARRRCERAIRRAVPSLGMES